MCLFCFCVCCFLWLNFNMLHITEMSHGFVSFSGSESDDCRESRHRSPCLHAESGNSANSMLEKQVLQALPACGIGKFGKQHAGEASAASPAGMRNWKIRQAACRRSRHCSSYRHAESGKFGKHHAGEASAASPAGMWNWKIPHAACRRIVSGIIVIKHSSAFRSHIPDNFRGKPRRSYSYGHRGGPV